jgi:hypothetical protein
MVFIAILFLSTLSIAGTAAFFSVFGLAQIFHGMATSVMIMGASLEAGKLVAASFLYRFWDKLSWWLKTYLVLAVLMLMVITSVGIFGMLSLGYQSDTLPLKQIDSKIELLKQEQTQLTTRKSEIDKQIQSLPSDMVKGRQKLMRTFDPELRVINKRIPEINTEMQQLSTQQLTTQAHVGPIIYIAKAFGSDVDDATKYVILLLIMVFDPLAVALTISVNIALKSRRDAANDSKSIVTEQSVAGTSEDVKMNSPVQLSPDEIKMLISEEIRQSIGDKEPDERLNQLYRKNQLVSDLRTPT